MRHSKTRIPCNRLPLRKTLSSPGIQEMRRFAEIPSVVLRRTLALCAIVAFVAFGQKAKTGHEPSRADTQNTVRIDVVESSEELHESLEEKPPLQFGPSRAPALTINVSDS